MKNKKHNKNIIFALIFLIMVITLINYKTQAEIKFEEIAVISHLNKPINPVIIIIE